MNFKQMKLKKSLLIGFAIAMVPLVVILIFCLFNQRSMQNQFNSLIATEVQCNTLMRESRYYANSMARDLREMGLFTDNTQHIKELDEKIASNQTKLHEKLDELLNLYPYSDSLARDYADSITTWEQEIPDITAAFHAGNTALGADLVLNQCVPAMDNMRIQSEELTESLTAHRDEAIQKQQRSAAIAMIIAIVVVVLAVILACTVGISLIRAIVPPLEETRRAMVAMSKGDLRQPVTFVSGNEVGSMCDALRTSQKVLASTVEEISSITTQMADGNFTVEATADYPGDLEAIKTSINELILHMSDTLSNISNSADQVAGGSDQVSNSAQALAQGATEQASSVEELSATITDISNTAKETAAAAEAASRSANEAGEQVAASDAYVKQLNEAMGNISNSSQEISKIIKTIEDIAFQTNILALNAAVEAARAGTAGKGFAVVADEVRNLASKSDQAAKATTDLIDGSISAVKDGVEVVGRVTESLQRTIQLTTAAVSQMNSVTEAVESQTDAITQVTVGIDQISAVVQTNSATSQECAAASEELSSQAAIMHQLMAEFKVRRGSGSAFKSSFASSPAPSYSAPAEDSFDDVSYSTSASRSNPFNDKY